MKQKLKEVVEKLYDKRIDTLFVSDTSAVPYGYVIKEAFKTAYNKPLKVLRIDVHKLKYFHRPFLHANKEELEKKVQEISNKLQKFKSKKLAFFDECLDVDGTLSPSAFRLGGITREAYDLVINSTPESSNIGDMEYCGVATFCREEGLYEAMNFKSFGNAFTGGKIVTRYSPLVSGDRNKGKILRLIGLLKSFGREIGTEIKKKNKCRKKK